jgi:hypothetical protein
MDRYATMSMSSGTVQDQIKVKGSWQGTVETRHVLDLALSRRAIEAFGSQLIQTSSGVSTKISSIRRASRPYRQGRWINAPAARSEPTSMPFQFRMLGRKNRSNALVSASFILT